MAYPYTTPAEWFGFPDRPRCYLLEVDAFRVDISGDGDGCFGADAFGSVAFAGAVAPTANEGATTLRFSTHPHVTPATDSPASTEYDPRLSAVRVDTRISSGHLAGWFETFAESDVANGDGSLDTLLGLYAFEGRDCVIRLGEPGWYLDTGSTPYFSVVHRGQVRSVELTSNLLRFRIGHAYGDMEKPLALPTFAGTGGLEGGDDLAGKPKPAIFGLNRNFTLTLVDPATLTYLYHYRGVELIASIISLWDRGIPLTKVAGTPSTGEFFENPSNSTVILGFAPAGTVTADGYGNSPYTWKDIIEAIFVLQGIGTSVIDSGSWATYGVTYVCGLSTSTGNEIAQTLIAEMLAGVRLFGGFDRAGKFLIGRVTPSGTPAYSFTDDDIVDLERQALPVDLEPVVSRIEYRYQHNWTVQGDLASGVSASQRAFAEQEWRTVTRQDTALESRYRTAKTLPVNSPMDQQSNAITEANREFALWKTRRSFYRVTTTLKGAYQDAATGAKLDVGSIVSLTYGRFNLSAATGTVVSWALDSARGQVELGVVV